MKLKLFFVYMCLEYKFNHKSLTAMCCNKTFITLVSFNSVILFSPKFTEQDEVLKGFRSHTVCDLPKSLF